MTIRIITPETYIHLRQVAIDAHPEIKLVIYPITPDGASRALQCAECSGTGVVGGLWLIDPDDPRYYNPYTPQCPACQNQPLI